MQIINIDNITELNKMLGQDKPQHPLVAVVDFSKVNYNYGENIKVTSNFYSLMFKNHCHNKMKYGQTYYDFQEGTLACIGPKQVVTLEGESEAKDDVAGWGLFFHPDLIRGTSLGSKMKDYTFFSYDTNEALHLSDKEKQTIQDCIAKIEIELSENIDQHSNALIVSNIELLLNYCLRYYGRQFITRSNNSKSLLAKFENLLNEWFNSEKIKTQGLPTVKYCADSMYMSPNYLTDLLKKETGMNAQDHIHQYIIEAAKTALLNSNEAINEIAYGLGFEYPQYFSKLFKNKTGMTPAQFRSAN